MSDLSDKLTMVEKRARKEPKRLREIAMMKLINMLYEHFLPRVLHLASNTDCIGGSNAIRKEALAMRDWIYNTLNSSVADNIQKLIRESMNFIINDARFSSNPSSRYLYLLLLHSKCRNLSLTWFPPFMIGDVADMLKSLICLERIKWRYPYVGDKFVKNLKCCTLLKSFVYPVFCNDVIIKVLSKNCPFLSELDVSDSKRVTNKSTHYIKHIKSLMKCSIIGTSITIVGAMRILKSCPQLYKLNMHHSMYDILKGFEDVRDPIKLPLRTVMLRGHSITRSHIRLLNKYCPFLTHVEIDIQYLRIERHCQLINVERLTIKGYSDVQLVYNPLPRHNKLNTWLIGDSINVVNVHYVSLSDKDLVELSNVCPNITELYVVDSVLFNGDGYVSSEHHPFQKLKILKFIRRLECGNVSELDATIFKILLSYSTMITHVDIAYLNIGDDTVDTIFETNQMPDLQYWRIKSTRCTCRTLFKLFNMCPMLKFIGQLSTWNIHSDQVEEIESFMRKFNFDFDIDISRPDAFLQSTMNRARDPLRRTPM